MEMKFKQGDKVTISLQDLVIDGIELDRENVEIELNSYVTDILDELSHKEFTVKQGDFFTNVLKRPYEMYELEEMEGLLISKNDLELAE